jgi:outer membrane lipoprotein-sorting protein
MEKRMIISRRTALRGLALAPVAGRAWTETPVPTGLAPEDARDVARVVDYLQGLSSAKGRFIQTDARGGETRGTFFLQRPGRARFDYDPPSGLVIASDGHDVSVVDRRLKTIHAYPLSMTPLALFLARNIRLDRGVKVSEVIRRDGALTLVAEDARKKTRGSIALTLSDPPLALTGWTLRDARGGTVTVRLADFGPAEPQEADFFKLDDPRSGQAPEAPR